MTVLVTWSILIHKTCHFYLIEKVYFMLFARQINWFGIKLSCICLRILVQFLRLQNHLSSMECELPTKLFSSYSLVHHNCVAFAALLIYQYMGSAIQFKCNKPLLNRFYIWQAGGTLVWDVYVYMTSEMWKKNQWNVKRGCF